MNCEEYVVEKLKSVEKTNDSLKILIDNQTERINELIEKIDAFKDLIERTQLKFVDKGSYYGLDFSGYYLDFTDKGKDNIKAIINDLKALDLYEDIILEVEKREQNQ